MMLTVYSVAVAGLSNRPSAQSVGESARVVALTSELVVAREAAASAESEQGRLQGELTKVTDYWVASCQA